MLKSRSCPDCGKNKTGRIPRGIVVKTLLFWKKIKRYQCGSCSTKFYVSG